MIKKEAYPTLVGQLTGTSLRLLAGEDGKETTEFITFLNTWVRDRRGVMKLSERNPNREINEHNLAG